jgi:hypothetical protein
VVECLPVDMQDERRHRCRARRPAGPSAVAGPPARPRDERATTSWRETSGPDRAGTLRPRYRARRRVVAGWSRGGPPYSRGLWSKRCLSFRARWPVCSRYPRGPADRIDVVDRDGHTTPMPSYFPKMPAPPPVKLRLLSAVTRQSKYTSTFCVHMLESKAIARSDNRPLGQGLDGRMPRGTRQVRLFTGAGR